MKKKMESIKFELCHNLPIFKDEKKFYELTKKSLFIKSFSKYAPKKVCECRIENYQNFHKLSPKKSPFTKNVISRYVQACLEGSYKTLLKFIEFEVNSLPENFTKEQCKYLSKRYFYLGCYYDIEVKRKKGTFVMKKSTRPYDDYKKDTLPEYEEYLEERFA